MNTTHTPLIDIGKQFTERQKTVKTMSFCWLEANTQATKVVILVHGVTGNKLDMAVLGAEYIARGFAVYAPDLPGHGKAPVFDAKSFNDLGDWLRDCIAAIGRTPDILNGNSFASGICYNFATQGYLNERTRLILTCPTPDIAWTSRAVQRASGLLPGSFVIGAYNSRLAIGARVAYLSKSKEKSAKKWLRESEYLKIPFIDATVGHQLSNLLNTHNPYNAPMLPLSVQRQITVFIGTKDNVITRRSLPTLRRILPKAKILIIPEVGHILHFEAPAEIANSSRI